MPCYEFRGIVPVVDPSSYVHPQAAIIGDVIIGPGCFVGPSATLRGDFGRIVVEGDASIQDAATVHVSSSHDTKIGRGSTIAHGAVVHGCQLGENCLIGINALVLDGAELGHECFVGALSMVANDMAAPPRSLLLGVPARIRRTLSPDEISWRNDGKGDYQLLAREAIRTMVECSPLARAEPDRGRTDLTAERVRLAKHAQATD
jgi:phenylacetic acid degradation protein